MMEQTQYIKKIFYNDTHAPYQQLSELLHASFQERIEANLNFGCATFTPEELKEATSDSYIVCYFDENTPIAMGVLAIKKKLGIRYGVFEFLAVSPDEKYRRKGLGGAVQRERVCVANELGLGFITSSTAIDAVSSVKCHLKTGFKIYRKKHYMNRNYVSYCFIYPLKHDLFNTLFMFMRKPIYSISEFLVK